MNTKHCYYYYYYYRILIYYFHNIIIVRRPHDDDDVQRRRGSSSPAVVLRPRSAPLPAPDIIFARRRRTAFGRVRHYTRNAQRPRGGGGTPEPGRRRHGPAATPLDSPRYPSPPGRRTTPKNQ